MPASGRRTVRRPAVAGLFYPADEISCAAAAQELLRANASASPARPWRGAIVPHAGWVCSGAIAGESLGTVGASRQAAGLKAPDLVVIFGAVHTPLPLDRAAFASHQGWEVPGGTSDVPVELAEKLQSDQPQRFAIDDRFHAREHAVEVELPLVQRAWPDVGVLPVEVPAIEDAMAIGQRTARAIASAGFDAIYLASSDLTHYGPAYGFAPAGIGPAGLEWAKHNDQRLLEVVTRLRVEQVVQEVRENNNACGAGAIVAMMAACQEAGFASEARVLRHASSFETLAALMPNQTPDNAVGYAAVVIG